MLTTSRLNIRPTEKEDIPFVVQVEEDTENRSFINANTAEQHLSIIENPDELHLIVEAAENNKKVGFIILGGIENPHHSMEFRRVVVTEKGKGYGKEILNAIEHFCFKTKGFNRLWLDVLDTNVRAIGLYEKQGFQKEGVLRGSYFDGTQYRNLVILAKLKEDTV